MRERLQKIMARAGLGSRRACEELIKQKRVLVNGQTAVLGQKADPVRDQITVDGEPLRAEEAKRYIVLNKPVGYITSAKDQFGRKTVMDLVPDLQERVYPVGRLDYDSQGLVFLTNDGMLAYAVMHPKFELPKTYLVEVEGKVDQQVLRQLRAGVVLEDGPTAPAEVRLCRTGNDLSLLWIRIIEGRNRQIRRMCKKVGCTVRQLTRTAIGPLELGGMAAGAYRNLSSWEVQKLRRMVNNG